MQDVMEGKTRYIGNLSGYRDFLRLHGGWHGGNPIQAYQFYTNKYGWAMRFIYAGNCQAERQFKSKDEAVSYALAWVKESPEKRLAQISD